MKLLQFDRQTATVISDTVPKINEVREMLSKVLPFGIVPISLLKSEGKEYTYKLTDLLMGIGRRRLKPMIN